MCKDRVPFAYLAFKRRIRERLYHGPLDGDHLIFRNSGTSSSRLLVIFREKNTALSCVMLDDNRRGTESLRYRRFGLGQAGTVAGQRDLQMIWAPRERPLGEDSEYARQGQGLLLHSGGSRWGHCNPDPKSLLEACQEISSGPQSCKSRGGREIQRTSGSVQGTIRPRPAQAIRRSD